MRLLTRTVYRAFPELDSFDDGLCRAFVRVAASSWRARAVRYLSVALIGVATLALAIVLSAALHNWRALSKFDDGPRLLLASVPLTLTLAAGFLAAMLVRDRLLRRRVRKLIRDRGGCPHCGYRLLGVPVDAELRVVCPECGKPTVVDAAMGELAAGAAGQRVYNAVLPRIDERGRRRRRRVVKTVFWGGGSILTLLLLAYGSWWVVLIRDARAARSERDGAARWREMIAAAQPIPGSPTAGDAFPPAQLDAANRWSEFEAAITEVSEATRRFATLHAGEYRYADGRFATVEYLQIGEAPVEFYRGKAVPNAASDFAVQEAMARAAVADLQSQGVIARLSAVRGMSVVMRPTPETDSSSGMLMPGLIGVRLPHLGASRQAARLCVARMHLALEAGDQDAYIDALDTGMAVARVLETGTTIIERLVATAIEALMFGRVKAHLDEYPTESWTAAVRETLDRRRQQLGTNAGFLSEGVLAADYVKWFFAQPEKVQRAALLGDLEDLGLPGRSGPALWKVGTYKSNIRAFESLYPSWAQYAALEPHSRPAPPPASLGSDLVLPQALAPAFQSAIASEDKLHLQRRELDLLLAIRHHTQRNGHPPGKAEDLVPDELAALPIDPFSGRPLGFTLVPAAGGASPTFQVAPIPDPSEPAAESGSTPPGP